MFARLLTSSRVRRPGVRILSMALVALAVALVAPFPGASPAGAAPSHFVSVSAGDRHTCAVAADTSVRCWGSNEYGELGDGTTGDANKRRLVPVTVKGLTGAKSVGVGNYRTCALLNNGTVKCWGHASTGGVGDGTEGDANGRRLTPVSVSGLSGVTAISVAGHHACAVLSDATLKCWGNNIYGQTGGSSSGFPTLVPTVVRGVTGVRQVAAGSRSTCALLTNETVKCWGGNKYGELGDGTTGDANQVRLAPVTVKNLTGVKSLSAGTHHACALLAGGTAKCWGENKYGQLGDGTTGGANNLRTTPVSVKGLSGATSIVAGGRNTCALLPMGKVSCWGDNYSSTVDGGLRFPGQYRLTPVLRADLTGVTALSVGLFHVCAFRPASSVLCWGDGYFGQLGDGYVSRDRYVAVAVVSVPEAPLNVSVVARSRSVDVSWKVPSGSTPALYWVVTPYIGWIAQTPKIVYAGSSTTVTGLTPGTSYGFIVKGYNLYGEGRSSAPSAQVKPLA